jgi:hypothetical protein
MFQALVEWFASKVDRPRVIYDRAGVSPYLSRYYLFGRPTRKSGGQPFDEKGNPYEDTVWPHGGWGLYLHKFHRGDDDKALHSHPWAWALSLILVGGYDEDRRNNESLLIHRKWVSPGSLNLITQDDYHRVDLRGGRTCWSLFLAGPKVDSWNFWDPETGRTVHWRQFIKELRDPTLDELIEEVGNLPGMTEEERAHQRLDFAYGNLAASTNHKPTRRAFLDLANEMGIDEVTFDRWAHGKKWHSIVDEQSAIRLHPDPAGGRYGDS